MIELSKYIVEALGRDKDFNLYRATSKEGNSQILVLSPAAEYPRWKLWNDWSTNIR